MTAEVSHGRGGAGNINPDDTQYVDGSIVRAGPEGSHGDGAYSAGRGGMSFWWSVLRLRMPHPYQSPVLVDDGGTSEEQPGHLLSGSLNTQMISTCDFKS